MSTLHKAGSGLALAGLALALIASAISAQTLELVYTGSFSSAGALNLQGPPLSDFTSPTPFLVTAFFDASSPILPYR